MPFNCPICKSPAQQLPNIADATAYRCVFHYNFKVADAVWRDAENYTREQWEIACARQGRERSLANGPLSEEEISDCSHLRPFCNQR